jgi:Arc/MetJ-type ribon-helix-helix transcriptional regulator
MGVRILSPPRILLCNAKWYTCCMAQLVTRIDEQLASDVDDLVRDGVVTSRSEAVRMGLEQLIDRHRRQRVGAQITEAYRRLPQTVVETTGLDEATRALVEEEPW